MTKKTQINDVDQREPVLSLPVAVARLKSLGEVVKAKADAGQCEELRQRLGILAVNAYGIEARVSPWKKNGVRIDGHLTGNIDQACVVSLVPVTQEIDEDFSITLVPAGSPFARRSDDQVTGGEIMVDPEGEDPPEEFEGEEIDVGHYAEEFFALALDDYPRAPEASFSGHTEDQGGPQSSDNPFAALAGLREEMSKGEDK